MMSYTYDTENIFAKILRGEIPNTTVFENEHVLAFRDIAPAAPDHVLVIPKGPYVNYDHFATDATDVEIIAFNRAIGTIIHELNIAPCTDGNGYRLIANTGSDGVQDVPHLHMHILAGRNLKRMVQPA
jgi:histidine triad (HIT) family protein